MYNLVATVFCTFLPVAFSNDTDEALRMFLQDRIWISENNPSTVTLNHGHVVICLGVLTSPTLFISSATCIEHLQPDFNRVTVIVAFVYFMRHINHIHRVEINSFDNPSLKARDVDFAVVRLTANVLPTTNHLKMSGDVVHPGTSTKMVAWETDCNDPTIFPRPSSQARVKLVWILILSNDECAHLDGHPLDHSQFCGQIINYRHTLDNPELVFGGAPLTIGSNLVGIAYKMNVDSTPQIILFTRISSYKKYIEHETNDESDDDDTESVWSSDHSNEC